MLEVSVAEYGIGMGGDVKYGVAKEIEIVVLKSLMSFVQQIALMIQTVMLSRKTTCT